MSNNHRLLQWPLPHHEIARRAIGIPLPVTEFLGLLMEESPFIRHQSKRVSLIQQSAVGNVPMAEDDPKLDLVGPHPSTKVTFTA
jgi:hypothetical protein